MTDAEFVRTFRRLEAVSPVWKLLLGRPVEEDDESEDDSSR